MAPLKTLAEAEQVFNTYFYYGNKRTLTTITNAQIYDAKVLVNWQKMGQQLQFLAALYPRTTSYKTPVKNEISRLLGIMDQAGLFSSLKLTSNDVSNDPGAAMTLLGLVQLKKGAGYTALSSSDKIKVDTAIRNHVSVLGLSIHAINQTHGSKLA